MLAVFSFPTLFTYTLVPNLDIINLNKLSNSYSYNFCKTQDKLISS